MSSKRAARGSSQYENYDPSLRKDAIVMATAMASASEEQARSPESQPKDGQNIREMYLLEEAAQEEQLPSSPMVTPPARSYAGRGKKPAASPVPAAGVPHVYRDFSQVPDDFDYTRKKTGGVTQPFPEKLHEMLQDVGDSDMVGWLPHGRAFIVRKPRDFTDQIMPKYFKQTKLTSFQRQLNLYGFRRLTHGPDAGAYYHEMFLRARPALCQRMSRQKVKGTGHKQPSDAKTEPNFYLMRPVDPMPVHNFGDTTTTEAYNQEFRAPPPPQPIYAQALTTTTYRGVNLTIPDSPASPGMHGAAHLLHGMASGYKNLKIPSATAMDGGDEDTGGDQGSSGQKPSSFLQPRLTLPSFKRR